MQEGILNVADVDTVMSQGLGPRYAFLGPLETAHLNAEGNNMRQYRRSNNKTNSAVNHKENWLKKLYF